jgi:hypothetical protein
MRFEDICVDTAVRYMGCPPSVLGDDSLLAGRVTARWPDSFRVGRNAGCAYRRDISHSYRSPVSAARCSGSILPDVLSVPKTGLRQPNEQTAWAPARAKHHQLWLDGPATSVPATPRSPTLGLSGLDRMTRARRPSPRAQVPGRDRYPQAKYLGERRTGEYEACEHP